jgi:phage terminase large subunit-like protein
VAGDIVAGPHVRDACQRHLRDLDDGAARGLKWDLAAAGRVLRFFPKVLKLAGGQFEGKRFDLEPSQAFIVGSIAGWRKADGTRRFRRAYIEEGKGNGKSPLVAGIGIYFMSFDDEARSEVYAAARTKEQAMVLFRDAVAMWQQSPKLFDILTPSGVNPVTRLTDIGTGSFFTPISSGEGGKKGGGQSGPRPHCAICDEVHEHENANVITMLERGFKFRRQPLLLMITNSGSDRKSVCWQEHQHAVKVASGLLEDDSTFSYVCALDEGDDPLEDPTCWLKANPLLGKTVTVEYIAGLVKQAKQIPGKENEIRRLHFCQWTDAADAWMSRPALEAVLADFDPYVEHAGKKVSVGGDFSASQDLSALGFCVETGTKEVERIEKDTGIVVKVVAPTFDLWIETWTPEQTATERAIRDNAPYDLWIKDGFLFPIPGPIIRLDFLAARLAEVSVMLAIGRVGYDRYAFRKFEEECGDLGLTLDFIEHPQGGKKRGKAPEAIIAAAKLAREEPPQGLWMPGSVNEIEQLILEQRIRIRNSPVTISAFMSAVIEKDPFENRWFSKRYALNRIDPLVAGAMAVGVATAAFNRIPVVEPRVLVF